MQESDTQSNKEQESTKEFSIVVNAREKPWLDDNISFQQVIILAFGIFNQESGTAYTISYKRGHGNKEGLMVPGDVVKVKDKMIFNVTATNKS